ncbi:Hypothetical protein POVR1_LOCUS136 [uncultured virus]|nr:Hypothetical protein POVR1_LOCUS136 [uncultured virus]
MTSEIGIFFSTDVPVGKIRCHDDTIGVIVTNDGKKFSIKFRYFFAEELTGITIESPQLTKRIPWQAKPSNLIPVTGINHGSEHN